MEDYERLMGDAMRELAARGVRRVAFGDIFLADLRAWREERLAGAGTSAVFPLWGGDTTELLRGFTRAGFRAVLVCVDRRKLDRSFAGRELGEPLLGEFPAGVDPCGENGEYHSFVYDGPVFSRPVAFERGVVLDRGDRSFVDLLPPGVRDDAPPLPEPQGTIECRTARPDAGAGR